MKKIKIIVTDYIEENLDWEAEQLKQLPVEFIPLQLKNKPVDELIEQIKDAHVLVVNMIRVDRTLLTSLPRCKLIIRHGAGYDNIDIAAATEFGIQVCYVPDYCQEEVAEQALMLALACMRKFNAQLASFGQSVQKGRWDFSQIGLIRRFSFQKAGIVGCGRIGSKVLQMLRGFNMDVLICDPYLDEKRRAELKIECLPMDDLIREADLVTLHCSYTPETHHLINEEKLRAMKNNAILVNTSRGNVVDLNALARACREGWIAGAAIDVFGTEPPGEECELIGLNNVILTPHLSWYSVEAEWSIREKIIDDIRRYLNGLKPRYPINQL